jgi:acetyl esterase
MYFAGSAALPAEGVRPEDDLRFLPGGLPVDYTLDPELAAMAAGIPEIDPADVAGAREMLNQLALAVPPYEPQVPLSVQDVTVPGSGADVPVRVYAPTQRPAPLPGLLYLHSGGYVMGGGWALTDSPAKMIAERAGIVVVAVDYRLAPEHPYPAAPEDCYAVLEWVAAHGREHGIDPDRLAVLGESAGGGLAAVLTLLSRDRQGPRLVAQFLDAPMIDDSFGTPSMQAMTDAPAWNSLGMQSGWRHYLKNAGGPGGPEVPLHAAPARAGVKDLAGLPPAFVTAYEFDPLRDETLDYARLLIQAGVPAEVHHYPGAFHLAHVIPGTAIGTRMIADRIDAIQRMLHP